MELRVVKVSSFQLRVKTMARVIFAHTWLYSAKAASTG